SSLLESLDRLTAATGTTRVLIVDDQEPIRLVVRQFLSTLHYAIFEAATGQAGLPSAGEERPHVILLDLGLPDVDGWEILRTLKSDAATSDIPVVVMTSARLNRDQREYLGRLTAGIVSKDSL